MTTTTNKSVLLILACGLALTTSSSVHDEIKIARGDIVNITQHGGITRPLRGRVIGFIGESEHPEVKISSDGPHKGDTIFFNRRYVSKEPSAETTHFSDETHTALRTDKGCVVWYKGNRGTMKYDYEESDKYIHIIFDEAFLNTSSSNTCLMIPASDISLVTNTKQEPEKFKEGMHVRVRSDHLRDHVHFDTKLNQGLEGIIKKITEDGDLYVDFEVTPRGPFMIHGDSIVSANDVNHLEPVDIRKRSLRDWLDQLALRKVVMQRNLADQQAREAESLRQHMSFYDRL